MTRQEFKEKCIELRRQDFTISEITRVLNRSKTSVYHHVKKIPHTSRLLQKIREESVNRLNRIRPDLKGISWLDRHCKKFKKWTPDLVDLVAHTIFDGELSRTSVLYNNSNKVLIYNFKEKMKIIYDYEPKFYKTSGNVIRLAYHNVELLNFLKDKAEELKNSILSLDKEKQRAFLTAFFNDEGSVDFYKYRIRGYQHNDEILYLIHELLKNFDIESKIDNRFHEIIISRRENIEKFAKEINFSKGLRVNGKRSNSVWKKSLEKRKILANLLASYQ